MGLSTVCVDVLCCFCVATLCVPPTDLYVVSGKRASRRTHSSCGFATPRVPLSQCARRSARWDDERSHPPSRCNNAVGTRVGRDDRDPVQLSQRRSGIAASQPGPPFSRDDARRLPAGELRGGGGGGAAAAVGINLGESINVA